MQFSKFQLTLLYAIGIFIVFLGMTTAVGGDCGKYAAITKQLFSDGELFNLKIHGDAYLQKPPLLMWLGAAGFILFQNTSEFAFRFFPVLVSILSVLLLFNFVKRYLTREIAHVAAIFYMFSLIFVLYNNDVHTDSILTAAVLLAVSQFFVFIEYKNWSSLLLGFVGVGLGMLTKGPIALLIVGSIILVSILVFKEYKLLYSYKWLVGIPILGLMLLPYLWVIYRNFGQEGLVFFFWTNLVGRVDGSYQGRSNDYLYYIYNLCVIILPWFIFVWAGWLKSLISKIDQKRTTHPVVKALAFAVIPYFIVLSVSKMQSLNYLYPLIPFYCILGVYELSMMRNTRVWIILQSIVSILLLLMAWFVIAVYNPVKEAFPYIVVGLFSIVFVVVALKPIRYKMKLLTVGLLGFIAFAYVFNSFFIPFIMNSQSTIPAMAEFNSQAKDSDVLYTWGYPQFETGYYAKNREVRIYRENTRNDKELQHFDSLKDSITWLFCDQKAYDAIVNEEIQLSQVFEYKHADITSIRFNFLLPETRHKRLKTYYLLEFEK